MKKNRMLWKKLHLLSGKGMWHTNDCDGLYPQLHLSDGPHGLRKQDENAKTNNDSQVSTCYPTASCLAASWDRELVGKVADSLGKECLNEGVSILLAPGVNIKRSPLCGRNFEYFSEDPFLAGELGTAYINGVQKNGVGTSLKHFAANNQETRRMKSNSRVDERALREIYLSAFEACIRNAKPATVMVSYNYLNGYKATEDKRLLTDILRKEWGFKGVAVSDWGACIDLGKSIRAGLDLEMPGSGTVHLNELKKDLLRGRVTGSAVQRAIGRLEELTEKYAPKQGRTISKLETLTHETALEAALKGAVLLKNDGGILPIKEKTEINVIGELARTIRFQGGGSSHINTRRQPDLIAELEKAGFSVNFAPGYRIDTVREDETLKDEAVRLLRNGKLTIFCGGLTDLAEGEGYDRKSFALPENQRKLISRIENENVIFLSFGGSPYALPFLKKMKAMLHMYLGGEAVAKAAVMLLTGQANPQGKLAETWPKKLSDTPAYGNFATASNEILYKESLLVGYRHYDTLSIKPRFPFGFGLSYTTFQYSDLSVSVPGKTDPGDKTYESGLLKICFKIKNIGSAAGADVAQVYIENPDDGYLRARHELKGFEKVYLEPGEEKTVEITLNERAFSIYDTALRSFSVSAGEYVICVGNSVETLFLRERLIVGGRDYRQDPSGTDHKVFIGKNDSDLDYTRPGEYSVYNSLKELSERSPLARFFMKLALKITWSMFKGKPRNDPEVMMTVETVKDGPLDCIILQSGGMPYIIAKAIVRQANRGATATHRVSTKSLSVNNHTEGAKDG